METEWLQRGASPVLLPEEEERKLVKAEIEERLNDTILACALALKIVRNSNKPVRDLLNELMALEMRVGEFIGGALQARPEELKTAACGALAGVLSSIPLGNSRTRNARVVMPPKKKLARKATNESRRSKVASKKDC